MSADTPLEALLALAAEWEAEAAEEVGDSPELHEHSREGLAAGILENCATSLRDVVASAAEAINAQREDMEARVAFLVAERRRLSSTAAPQPPAEAQAQGGVDAVAWRILWSPDFPETHELTSDAARVGKILDLGNGPRIQPLYTAPPSAPGCGACADGCKGLGSCRVRDESPPSAPVGDDFCDGHCTWLDHAPGCPRHTPSAPVGVEEAAEDAAAIDKAWGRFKAAIAQQPAAVDGARPVEVTDSMVKAACGAYVRDPRNDAEHAKPGTFHAPSEHLQWHCRRMSRDRFEQFMRAALTAALAQQPAATKDTDLEVLIAKAVRSTGHVSNSDKWDVAEAVMKVLPAQQPAAVDGVCESAAEDCGPVAHYDSHGVPLCERCYRSLEASP